MVCGMQLYFCVSCLSCNYIEHLVVSLVTCFIQLLWFIATASDGISILACEIEAHLAAFIEQDEEFWVGFGGPRNRGSDVDIGSEDLLDLGTVIARVVLNIKCLYT